MKKHFLSVFAVFLLFLTGCQSNEGSYETIPVDEAKDLIDDGQVTILDVRTEEEFETGHIPGATLIPLDELSSRLQELDKNQSYLVVCRSGNRSAQASQILVDHEFKSVYNMDKGMNNWKYEVE